MANYTSELYKWIQLLYLINVKMTGILLSKWIKKMSLRESYNFNITCYNWA